MWDRQPRRYIVVLLYPFTLERKVIDSTQFYNKEDAKRYYEALYSAWKVTEIKEVIEDGEAD